ncbi:MAG TPA: hypothetical protein VFE90_25240, partial [Myxococcales bacterium]|nr:hypothetical protein [Myxococcales bacterium]
MTDVIPEIPATLIGQQHSKVKRLIFSENNSDPSSMIAWRSSAKTGDARTCAISKSSVSGRRSVAFDKRARIMGADVIKDSEMSSAGIVTDTPEPFISVVLRLPCSRRSGSSALASLATPWSCSAA